jgi:prevent-host-death family protein
MTFISVRDLRGRSAQVWKKLSREREIVITSNGKPIAVLSSVTEDNLEESLAMIRRARAMEALEQIHEQSIRAGAHHILLKDINEEINKVRKTRRS